VVLATDRRVLVRDADVRVDGNRVTVTGRFDRDFGLTVQPPG
jgi:hypothetical protein